MTNLTLLTDLYQLTMLQGYFRSKKIEQRSVFDLFYRNNPFNGGYAVFAGLEQIAEYLQNLKFSEDDIEYLKTLDLFAQDFLDYLQKLRFTGNLVSFKEGSIIFPGESLIRVEASLGEAQLIETAVLNIINFQTLIATKASRICYAADKRVIIEFGLRRAQGNDGAVSAARAAFIGGCEGTSNLLAGSRYNIPVQGTHAHSWIMAFENELEAFRTYSGIYPDKSIFLVDTYNSLESGIPDAITVAKELERTGNRLVGIRLDSGNLEEISKEARKMLNNEGLDYVKIMASGDLDEYAIDDLIKKGAPIDSFGVGTRLSTGYSDSALNGVYKLSALEENGIEMPKQKISDNKIKGNLPGRKKVLRYYDNLDKMAFDLVCLSNEKTSDIKIAYDLNDQVHEVSFAVQNTEEMIPIFKDGSLVYDLPDISEIQKNYNKNIDKLNGIYKNINNPDEYKVLISKRLYELRKEIIDKYGNSV